MGMRMSSSSSRNDCCVSWIHAAMTKLKITSPSCCPGTVPSSEYATAVAPGYQNQLPVQLEA
eukprot:1549429-Pyramimonas_sp.AAC.1